ncbi:O-antigen ligase family protein, partial [Paenibacillus sp. MMS18-CY102]|uniref:O-antigen ligase family protein n=1 Tax=Paenibacillus sp. MMS18-CY102 TaxID=2682849 RepID=UPI00136523AD
ARAIAPQAAGAASASFASAALLAACGLASAAGLLALRSRLLRAAPCSARTLAASAALLAGGTATLAALMPAALFARIGGHYETAASRASMYADALALWREAPLLGYGGDAWRLLAGERLGIREVHSGYLDLLLNAGIVGLALLLTIFSLLIAAIVRSGERRIMLAPIVVLLLHAAIDFDMSYGCWWLLFLAMAAYGLERQENCHFAAIEPD